MTLPTWLVGVLDRELPELTGGARDRLAQAIIAALPSGAISQAIAFTARDFLCSRAVNDRGGVLSREIGALAAPNVITALLDG